MLMRDWRLVVDISPDGLSPKMRRRFEAMAADRPATYLNIEDCQRFLTALGPQLQLPSAAEWLLAWGLQAPSEQSSIRLWTHAKGTSHTTIPSLTRSYVQYLREWTKNGDAPDLAIMTSPLARISPMHSHTQCACFNNYATYNTPHASTRDCLSGMRPCLHRSAFEGFL